jgi:hypothetical protein
VRTWRYCPIGQNELVAKQPYPRRNVECGLLFGQFLRLREELALSLSGEERRAQFRETSQFDPGIRDEVLHAQKDAALGNRHLQESTTVLVGADTNEFNIAHFYAALIWRLFRGGVAPMRWFTYIVHFCSP